MKYYLVGIKGYGLHECLASFDNYLFISGKKRLHISAVKL